jgi:hypothetical protein
VLDIPKTGDAPIIRTDFSDEAAWTDILKGVTTPSEDGFLAKLQIINKMDFDLALPEQIGEAARDTNHAVIFVVDRVTMTHAEQPILCLDVIAPENMFRVIPSELWGVENNLSLANMDFDEFAGAAEADGVFRGF